jgi:hypothetical protein
MFNAEPLATSLMLPRSTSNDQRALPDGKTRLEPDPQDAESSRQTIR